MTRRAAPRARARGAAAPRHEQARPPPGDGGPRRLDGLDALRGAALIAMIAYHFCFDLRYFGVTHWDFEHGSLWILARGSILSSFLLIAGVSAVLARRAPAADAQWLRHVLRVAAAAMLVTLASALMFPQSFIWFGTLHAIAVSLLIARPVVKYPAVAAVAGVIVIVAGNTLSDAAFDGRALGWLGFMTQKPQTEDYVSIFPWAGVLLVGVAAGHALAARRWRDFAPPRRAPAWVSTLGRHSLVVYLAHQPLLLAALWAAVA